MRPRGVPDSLNGEKSKKKAKKKVKKLKKSKKKRGKLFSRFFLSTEFYWQVRSRDQQLFL